jgi:predicted membrane-bound spermidine synthase
MPRAPQRFVLFAVFLLSGFSGLIYESLWTHYLKLYVGHAAFAQSLVLAIFMGGMALGGWLASLASTRMRNLLLGYAVVEAAIGAYALVFHGLFVALEDWSLARVIPGLGSAAAVDALQWAIAVALLLPPSIGLGATFPLMSGAVLRRFPGTDGAHLATLYFTNSIGAAAGALAASFWLVGWLGLPGTLTLAGVLNFGVAVLAGAIARTPETPAAASAAHIEPGAAGVPPPPRPKPSTAAPSISIPAALFIAAAFVTGAASFVYEIAWIRMLSLVLGSSLHAFELMLSAFITGLALGSLAIRRRIDRIADPLAFAAWIQVAMGLLAVATLPVYAISFEWMAALVKALPKTDDGWLLYNLASHGIAFAVMLPATFLAGTTLPLFTHVLLRAGHGEKCIGRVYAANSMGAIAGVLLAVHVGLPALGVELTLAAGALLDVALGVLLLQRAGVRPRTRAVALVALALPPLAVRAVTLDPAMLGSGVFRTGEAHPKITRTMFYRDGKTATISVAEYGGSVGVLSTNGKPDASIEMNPQGQRRADESTMVLAGALPLALRPDARHIANIGFGSGLTTHVALAAPGVAQVDTIEIEPAIVDASRTFGPRVARAYEDPRSRVHIADAKSWFARERRRFDVIVSEPSNPWVAGVASLFSDEFYHRVGAHLAERGLLVQWLHLYESDFRLVASIVKALDRHFADYAVYDVNGFDMLFVAVKAGRVPAPSATVFDDPRLRAELAHVGVRTIDDLRFRWIGSKADFGTLVRAVDVPANSDYRPYVELNAPRSRFLGRSAVDVAAVVSARVPLTEMLAPDGLQWTADRLSPNTSARMEFVDVARQLAAELTGRPGAGQAVRDGVADGGVHLADCAKLDAPAALGEVHARAAATLAFLDAASLAPLWVTPAWLPCPQSQWPAAFARRMALYRAVAQRDARAMGTLGAQLLDGDGAAAAGEQVAAASTDDPAQVLAAREWRRWALAAAMLGRYVQKDFAAVRALWQRHGPTLYPDGRIAPELVVLLAQR